MAMVLEQRLNGIPVHRFRFVKRDTDGVETEQSFSASWERSAKMWSAHNQGFEVTATNWEKDSDTWVNATQLALDEGFKRANRAKNGKDMPSNVINVAKPGIPSESAEFIKNHADYLRAVATTGKKSGIDDDTKKALGMDTLTVLWHAGYTIPEMKELFKQFQASIQAQANEVTNA